MQCPFLHAAGHPPALVCLSACRGGGGGDGQPAGHGAAAGCPPAPGVLLGRQLGMPGRGGWQEWQGPWQSLCTFSCSEAPVIVPLQMLVIFAVQVCPLTVPKYMVFKSGADEDTYLKQLGYRIRTDEDTGEVRCGCSRMGHLLHTDLPSSSSGAASAALPLRCRCAASSLPAIPAPARQRCAPKQVNVVHRLRCDRLHSPCCLLVLLAGVAAGHQGEHRRVCGAHAGLPHAVCGGHAGAHDAWFTMVCGVQRPHLHAFAEAPSPEAGLSFPPLRHAG